MVHTYSLVQIESMICVRAVHHSVSFQRRPETSHWERRTHEYSPPPPLDTRANKATTSDNIETFSPCVQNAARWARRNVKRTPARAHTHSRSPRIDRPCLHLTGGVEAKECCQVTVSRVLIVRNTYRMSCSVLVHFIHFLTTWQRVAVVAFVTCRCSNCNTSTSFGGPDKKAEEKRDRIIGGRWPGKMTTVAAACRAVLTLQYAHKSNSGDFSLSLSADYLYSLSFCCWISSSILLAYPPLCCLLSKSCLYSFDGPMDALTAI